MAADPTPTSKPSTYLQDQEEIGKVFKRFDANSDGQISPDELEGVMKALGSKTSPDEVAQMMKQIDTDKDGQVNLQEFTAFLDGDADPYRSEEKELKEAFELYDQDHDGKISAEELHLILTRLGEHCTVHDCAGMIKSVDADGDGYVNFEEFGKMMTNSKSKSGKAT